MSVHSVRDGDCVNIRVDGSFNFGVYRQFRASYRDTDPGHSCYRIDLGRTGSLDSSALGMLLVLREHAGDGSKVVLANPPPPVRRLLEVARFDRLFTLEAETADA